MPRRKSFAEPQISHLILKPGVPIFLRSTITTIQEEAFWSQKLTARSPGPNPKIAVIPLSPLPSQWLHLEKRSTDSNHSGRPNSSLTRFQLQFCH